MRKKLSTSFWLPDIDSLIDQYTTNQSSVEFVLRLTKIRRAISNFVRIVAGRDIPVIFSTGKQSYTYRVPDQDNVVVISASTDPSKLDVMVGLALHEAAHVILSNHVEDIPESTPLFDFLQWVNGTYGYFISSHVPISMQWDMDRLKLTDARVLELMHLLINYIEDRRIDTWMYDRAPGYRGYYDALYDEYWHHPKIGELLNNPRTWNPTIENYEFHIINMTNPEATPEALPGLKNIWKSIDLLNIKRFNTGFDWDVGTIGQAQKLPQIAVVALEVLGTILKNSQPTDRFSDTSATMKPEDQDNWDFSSNTGHQKNDKIIKDILKKQQEFLKGEVKKTELAEKHESLVDVLEKSGTMTKTVRGEFGDVTVVVHRKLTRSLIDTPEFIFSHGGLFRSNEMEEAIQNGINMGNILATKLQIMGEEMMLTQTRQQHGKIDNRLLAGLGVHDTRIFKRQVIDTLKPVELHFSIDASRSMQGLKWSKSMTLAIALAQAATRIPSLHVVLSLRGSKWMPCVAIIFDSRTDSMAKVRALFPYLICDGGTPEGLCFEAIHDLIISGSSSARRFFLNISDGQPVFMDYTGERAFRHTAGQVAELRRAGIEVLSYFVEHMSEQSSSKEEFKSMYGKSSYFVEPTAVTGIARTLNQAFLKQ